MGQAKLNRAGTIIFWSLRVFGTALVIAIPVLGVWVGSSLAAYLNGPVWIVCLCGLLLFPVIPVGWAWLSEIRKRRKRKRYHKQILTLWDRIVIRTFVLNGLFLGGMLWFAPQTAFTAISTRGDWMFDGATSDAARGVRDAILGAADKLAWLYESEHENEYEELIEDDGKPSQKPTPQPQSDEDDPWIDPWSRIVPEADDDDDDEPEPEPEPAAPDAWPQKAEIHPAVLSMPAGQKTSAETVGRYLAAQESDPYLRVKAVHDFVANHVAYDAVALAEGRYPPQDAATVLETGMGVCAGYANLFKAIGDATGDNVVVVVGDSRSRGGQISGAGHAWNAAEVNGRWYLIDATWDAGYVNGREFTKQYSTSYLFVPPAVMGVTHFPDEPDWQLRERPISRGEFARQPMMRPRFFAEGFSLQSPKRSQITTEDDVEILLRNPKKRHLLAHYKTLSGSAKTKCQIEAALDSKVTCEFPDPGEYQVSLFSSPKRYGTYKWLGDFQVNATG